MRNEGHVTNERGIDDESRLCQRNGGRCPTRRLVHPADPARHCQAYVSCQNYRKAVTSKVEIYGLHAGLYEPSIPESEFRRNYPQPSYFLITLAKSQNVVIAL